MGSEEKGGFDKFGVVKNQLLPAVAASGSNDQEWEEEVGEQ